jgi:hypothetical protein
MAVVAAPDRPFALELRAARGTTIRVPSASLADHATIVTVVLARDGSVDLGQHLVPLERADLPSLRQRVVGQLLHRSGELILRGKGSRLLDEVIHARTIDPLLSAMAFFARARSEGTAKDLAILRGIAQGLATTCGALPDSVVIRALASPADRDARMTALLDDGAIPLLAESARFLAEDAVRLGRAGAPVVEWVRRIPAGSIWSTHLG